MDTALHFRWYHLLVAAIFVTHLAAVTSLPWRSPPKWKLPPLPDRRTSSDGDVDQEDGVLRADLLTRVRHLEQVVQRRLDGIKLAKVRALEESIQQELADRGQGRQAAGHQGQAADRGQGRQAAGHQGQAASHQGQAAGHQGQAAGHQGQEQHKGAGVTETEGVLEQELLQHEEPHKGADVAAHGSVPAASAARQDQYNPMPKLKQISRDLVELIEEIDRHTQ